MLDFVRASADFIFNAHVLFNLCEFTAYALSGKLKISILKHEICALATNERLNDDSYNTLNKERSYAWLSLGACISSM